MTTMRDFELLPKIFGTVFGEHAVWKWLVGLGLALLNYLFPTTAMLAAFLSTGALIVLDTVTGFIASTITGKPISSAKAGRMVLKLMSYGIAVIVVALAANTLPAAKSAHEFCLSLVLASIAYTELVSISENLDASGFPLPAAYKAWLRGRKKLIGSAEETK